MKRVGVSDIEEEKEYVLLIVYFDDIKEVPNGGTVDESDTLVGEEDVGNRVEREVPANPEYDWVDEKALAT